MIHIPSAIKRIWSTNPSLCALVVFSLFCLGLSTLGFAFDSRHINNEHAWIKPCKFSISFAIYGATLIWLGQFLTRHKRFFHGICVSALSGGVIELSAIILQVLRGTTSHFNVATPFDHGVFIIIKLAIMPLAFAILATFVLLLRQRDLPPVVGTALHWAVFLTLIGLIPGVLMLLPDPWQDAITQYKQFDGHTVGYPEGGPGLPWLGWSTVAGDLRIAHFVGIHALQVLPIVGFAVMMLLPNLSNARQRALVWNAGLTYLAVILILTWQALRAESIVTPGMKTLVTVSFAAAACVVAAMVTILWPQSRQGQPARAFPTMGRGVGRRESS